MESAIHIKEGRCDWTPRFQSLRKEGGPQQQNSRFRLICGERCLSDADETYTAPSSITKLLGGPPAFDHLGCTLVRGRGSSPLVASG